MTKFPVLAVLAVGALGLAVGGGVVGAEAGGALGWAAAAGTFLLIMLSGGALRPMGVLLALLGVGGGVTAVLAGGWGIALLLPSLLLVAGGVAAARWGPSWATRQGSGPREAPMDQWKQFDAGADPTGGPDVEDVAGDTDNR